MLLPQVPLAVNVNGRLTVVPPLVTIPYVWGLLGDVMPPVACRVATRLLELPQPVFFNPKLTVTVSPGSIAPLVGMQLSAVSVAPFVAMSGEPLVLRERFCVVVPPLVTVTPLLVTAPPHGPEANKV